ncbi:MAG: ABC transporter substrate-binding protein [Planctomycetota bacterium]|nr:ABC transporter substrate-binding protein [Planctomycetota bacterium]
MRRYAFVILFVVVLVTPFLLKLALGTETGRRSGGAELPLVIISPHGEGIRREFAEAFDAYHRATFGQGVRVDYRSYGGASDIVRFFDSSRDTIFKDQGTYGIDLVWGGGDYLFDVQLKNPKNPERGVLQPVALDPAVMRRAFPSPDLGGVPLFDSADEPHWFGTALSSFGIVYNKDVVRHLGLPEPKTWRDMADPRYSGWIGLADPTRSASARTAFMTIIERAMADAREQGRSEDDGWADGMGLVRLISSNARLFSEASSSVPGLVSTGDAAAGMAIDFYARSQIEAVGELRLGYVEPAAATIVNPDPIAMVRGARHPETAKRFIEFVLSERGQLLWNTRAGAPGGPKTTSLRRLPIMPTLYAPPHNRDFTDAVNPFAISSDFNTSNVRRRTFTILGELIQVSCMDVLDELRETRAAIAASPRAADLEAKLGRFPFDQKEALARAERLSKAPAIERLAMLRQWTNDFRAEYRQLREEAKQ